MVLLASGWFHYRRNLLDRKDTVDTVPCPGAKLLLVRPDLLSAALVVASYSS